MAEAGGGTRQALTKQQVEELSIITPSFSEQTAFSEFIQQSDKSKFAALNISNLNLSHCLEIQLAILMSLIVDHSMMSRR